MSKYDGYHFRGFPGPRYTPTPDALFDELLAPGLLTEAELRVLLYIVRRTFGWKKESDAISLTQLTDGIVKRDGTRLDYGAGVSRPAVLRGVRGLETKGIITATRMRAADGEHETTVYSLCMEADRNVTTAVTPRNYPGNAVTPQVVTPDAPQETPSQQIINKNGSDSAMQAQIHRDRPDLDKAAIAHLVAACHADAPSDWLAWWQARRYTV